MKPIKKWSSTRRVQVTDVSELSGMDDILWEEDQWLENVKWSFTCCCTIQFEINEKKFMHFILINCLFHLTRILM